MPTDWTAHYLDGRTATRHPVTLTIAPAALHLRWPDGALKRWPYDQIRQTQGTYHGEPVRLEFGPEPAEAVVVTSPALLTALHQAAPTLVQHFHDPSRRRGRGRWTFCAALGVLLMMAGLYRWGIPGMAAVATHYVPPAWEETLGQQVTRHLAPEARQCRDPERLRKLEQVVQPLLATRPESPYRIRLAVVDAPAINAFAVPGGQVVILRGLLEHTANPEQLAGVMAHELQHVYQRHATRAILEQTAATFLLTIMSGDVSGGLALGVDGARTMSSLHYSRTHETEADIEGLHMMKAARLDPAAMISFYELMQQDTEGHGGPPEFLATHPDMEKRLATLAALAGSPLTGARTLLPGEDWTDIRSLCRLHSHTDVLAGRT